MHIECTICSNLWSHLPPPVPGAVDREYPSTMDIKRCNYVGCYNTSETSWVFPYPADDWKRLNLWLLHSGKSLEFHNKYICANHFPPSKVRRDAFGIVALTEGAVPRHYLNRELEDSDEEKDLKLKKPDKIYPKLKTYRNIHLTQAIKKENEREEVSGYTMDANSTLTDAENNNSSKNTDRQIFDVPENSTEIRVKKEPEDVLEFNEDETDNAEELEKTINIEASTGLQIKIEPLDEADIKLEKDSERNTLEVELEMALTNKPSSDPNYHPETNHAVRIHFEEVVIKVEQSTDDVEMPDVMHKETSVTSNVVLDIKREWSECSDPEVECGDPGVECSSESIECDSAVVGCTTYTLNTEAQLVELTNVNKQSETTDAPKLYDAETEQWCCGACGARYHHKYDLQRHRVARHGAPKYPKRIFKVAPNEPLRCAICKTQFQQRSDLQRHMDIRHQSATKPFQCDVCFMRYKYEFMMIAHKKEHSGTDFHCDQCGRECKTKRGLAKHLNSHTKERVFSCPTCEHTFTERTHLLNHLIKHTPGETFLCISCNKTFHSATELKAHSSVHRTYFACKVCGAKFPEESGLGDHMKVHTKFLECTFCLKQFKDVGDLQRHTDTHQDMLEKVQGSSHVCPQCGKRFLYRSLLIAHEKIHSSERPFSCEKCPKRFKTSSACNEHARGHDMLYKCSECGKSFARSATLALHRRLHTGEKPYSCHLCDKAFAQRVSMNYHLKKFHSEQKTRKIKKPKNQKTKKNKPAKT